MGHYDMEDVYAEQRAVRQARAERAIPEIIGDFTLARQKLARHSQDVKHAARIIDEIDFVVSALRGQLGRAA